MKKIGIVTFWGVPNYGAWAQAYALNKTVRALSHVDDEVFHIEHLSREHWELYYKNNISLYNAFSYNWDEIRFSKAMTELEIENTYFDLFITGSDAIWEFSRDNASKDMYLVGGNIKANKIMSYAVSMGETEINDVPEEVKNELKKYSKITVRDTHSKEIVEKLIKNSNAEVVLDPSLLYDFKNDEGVKRPRYKNYVAVYGGNFSPEFIESTIEFARKNNLEIISLGYINTWCDKSIKMIELRAFEWLGFIKDAELVVTSMFHGLMLSLSFNKQVKFEQLAYVRNRSQDLLELLDIEKVVKNFDMMLDYVSINEKLYILRNKSIDILRKELADV